MQLPVIAAHHGLQRARAELRKLELVHVFGADCRVLLSTTKNLPESIVRWKHLSVPMNQISHQRYCSREVMHRYALVIPQSR